MTNEAPVEHVIHVNLRTLWEWVRPFVLAALMFANGWLWFHETTALVQERQLNGALRRWEQAADAYDTCSRNSERLLYWVGIRHESEQPAWLASWLQEE